jgi:preprotein translocase subunit YajC
VGGFGFFLIVIAFGFLYFVLVRPQKKRQLQQQRMLDKIAVGDEIVTAGGMFGEVREVRDDEVLVRIAPDLDVRIARRAVAGVVAADEPEALEGPEETGPTPGT